MFWVVFLENFIREFIGNEIIFDLFLIFGFTSCNRPQMRPAESNRLWDDGRLNRKSKYIHSKYTYEVIKI